MKYKILSEKLIHNAFFKIKEALMSYDHFDGSTSKDVCRFALDKGPAVASIIHLYDIDKYVFIKQFRYPVTLLKNENPWIWEVVAGVIDPGFSAEQAIIKEIKEESGYVPEQLELITDMWTSPGISSEQISLYWAHCHSQSVTSIGDPNDDDEDIQAYLFTKQELTTLLASKEVKDAKTLVALQYILMR